MTWLRAFNFRFRQKSSDYLVKGLSLAKAFEELSGLERLEVIGSMRSTDANKLLSLSAFMAEKAIDSKDPLWIKAALLMHLIEDFKVDHRENIRYLVLISYSAKKIGADFFQLVNSIISFSSDRARSRLREFLSRDETLNELSSFGVKEIKVDHESRFVPI